MWCTLVQLLHYSYGKFWINTVWCTLVQLLHYILKCIYLEWRLLFVPFRYMLIQTVRLMSTLLASLMRNYFPKRPSGAPIHTLSNLYDVPVGFVTPPPILRLCIALFAVAEGWLLLDIGWFVLFNWHFCWRRGFCHMNESDLVLFLLLVLHCISWFYSISRITPCQNLYQRFWYCWRAINHNVQSIYWQSVITW